MQFGDFAEVVVVGVKLGVEDAGEADELGIDFGFTGEIGVVDFDFVALVLLDAGEHFEAAAGRERA